MHKLKRTTDSFEFYSTVDHKKTIESHFICRRNTVFRISIWIIRMVGFSMHKHRSKKPSSTILIE